MSAVWLCQCLCPERHAILAAAGEARTLAEAQMTVRAPLASQVAELLRKGLLNPWCALCGAKSETWVMELGQSRYATMAEATPALLEQELANRVANIVMGDQHKGTKH